MRQLTLDEAKKIEIEILDVVAQFCEERGINYFLDSGTLLGAVRHKGFIPWDDDIDVGMLRCDYDRFMDIFNNDATGERYVFKSIETNSEYPFAFGKVLDTNTVLYEPDEKGIKHSVNIDIFPYDNAPDDSLRLKFMYFCRDIYKSLRLMQLGFLKPNGSFIKRFFIVLVTHIARLFPQNFFTKRILANAKRYSYKKCSCIGDFTSTSYVKCSKSIFSDFVKLTFEGKTYNAPRKFDVWLKKIYGDYMKLPPENERKSNHYYVAYIDDDTC